ncbi:hypothetical protein HA402_001128 [Bradysia odoriphaga]|nr:hypothetical protein HA402_001128 [Bradysia odoriphaga]
MTREPFRTKRYVEDDPNKGIIQLGSTQPHTMVFPFGNAFFDKSDKVILKLLEAERNSELQTAWEEGRRMFMLRKNELGGVFENDNYAIAAIVYTLKSPPMYTNFNKATRDYRDGTTDYRYNSYLCLLYRSV